MRFRPVALSLLSVALMVALLGVSRAQTRTQTDLSPVQRLDVMRSKLEAMKRALSSAIAGIPQKDKNAKVDADDPRVRLQGLDKEVSAVLSDVNDLHAKQDRSERYDVTKLDTLEASVTELDGKVQAGLQATASSRTGASTTGSSASSKPKKKGGFRLWPFGGGSDNDKYEELTSTVAPGRDRVLFEDAAKEVRKGNHETGRLLFTTIITTYPDSPFLPLAKLAIADSFYLEGGTSSLIQAAASYQDWLTFFPTDPLADAAMLKVAEAEMRQMGLSNRDVSHARKAEQRLKALLQTYPNTRLRASVEDHLREVQENLGLHSKQVGDFYYESRFRNGKGGLKGAQSRYKEIVDKYPNFSYMDEVLFRLATTYQLEEEPDEAAKFYQRIARDYPNSDYIEKAKEQLNIIGAPIPEPNPERKNVASAERPGFMKNVMQEVAGRAEVTVGKDGILISHDRKEGEDLIDQALKFNGQLPTNTTPTAPVQRRDPPKPKPNTAASNPTPTQPDKP
ncbi:MAG TPA: outer membrane protein assembly factor BamD [Pyrinomonadaceae bacterium]|nr:outer membrane protein assembly factor BamD [Pyrinomonadaceae bacterium]